MTIFKELTEAVTNIERDITLSMGFEIPDGYMGRDDLRDLVNTIQSPLKEMIMRNIACKTYYSYSGDACAKAEKREIVNTLVRFIIAFGSGGEVVDRICDLYCNAISHCANELQIRLDDAENLDPNDFSKIMGSVTTLVYYLKWPYGASELQFSEANFSTLVRHQPRGGCIGTSLIDEIMEAKSVYQVQGNKNFITSRITGTVVDQKTYQGDISDCKINLFRLIDIMEMFCKVIK